MLVKMRRNGNLVHFWWECKMAQPLHCFVRKTVWWFLKILNIKLPYDPIIPPLDIYPEELKAGTQTDTCMPILNAALFILAKRWKQPKCLPIDE